ncbi:MAG: transposase, partial [Paraclostridium sp.]
MPLNNQLVKIVENLNSYELEELESKVEELLGKSLSQKQIIKLVEEAKFNRGEKCPNCEKTWIIKNGKIKGRQKYKCKSCGKQFDEFTNSPLSNTKLPLKIWNKFCKLMFQGLSLNESREELKLTIKTLFYMRHRILDIVNLIIENKDLKGVVEADQKYFR